jgi:hypothetical protein
MDATEKKQPNQYLCEFVIELMLNAKKNKGILFKILLTTLAQFQTFR